MQVPVPKAQWGQTNCTLEFGAEKGLLQGQARRWVAHAPENPKVSEGFQQSTSKGKVREGVRLVVTNFSVSESFVLAAVPVGQLTMFL